VRQIKKGIYAAFAGTHPLNMVGALPWQHLWK